MGWDGGDEWFVRYFLFVSEIQCMFDCRFVTAEKWLPDCMFAWEVLRTDFCDCIGLKTKDQNRE